MRLDWDRMIQALVLIRLGQELGTCGPLAQGVAAFCEIAGKLAGLFSVDKF